MLRSNARMSQINITESYFMCAGSDNLILRSSVLHYAYSLSVVLVWSNLILPNQFHSIWLDLVIGNHLMCSRYHIDKNRIIPYHTTNYHLPPYLFLTFFSSFIFCTFRDVGVLRNARTLEAIPFKFFSELKAASIIAIPSLVFIVMYTPTWYWNPGTFSRRTFYDARNKNNILCNWQLLNST